MKKYLKFVLSFVTLSALLFMLQDYLAFGYDSVLLWLMDSFRRVNPSQPYYESSFRVILLIALLLVTPGVPVKKRLSFLVAGIFAFLLLDLVSFLLWTTPPPPPGSGPVAKAHIVYSLVWRMLGHWVLPFVFWIAMTREPLLHWYTETVKAG